LLQATRTVPIVFAQVIDPVGAGFVTSLARWRAPAMAALIVTAMGGAAADGVQGKAREKSPGPVQ
jgi:hypothetical protein